MYFTLPLSFNSPSYCLYFISFTSMFLEKIVCPLFSPIFRLWCIPLYRNIFPFVACKDEVGWGFPNVIHLQVLGMKWGLNKYLHNECLTLEVLYSWLYIVFFQLYKSPVSWQAEIIILAYIAGETALKVSRWLNWVYQAYSWRRTQHWVT